MYYKVAGKAETCNGQVLNSSNHEDNGKEQYEMQYCTAVWKTKNGWDRVLLMFALKDSQSILDLEDS